MLPPTAEGRHLWPRGHASTHMHTLTSKHIHTNTRSSHHTRTRAHTNKHMHTRTGACAHTHADMHTHTHTRSQTHTHAHVRPTGMSAEEIEAAVAVREPIASGDLSQPLKLFGEDAILDWPGAMDVVIRDRDTYMARTLAAAATGVCRRVHEDLEALWVHALADVITCACSACMARLLVLLRPQVRVGQACVRALELLWACGCYCPAGARITQDSGARVLGTLSQITPLSPPLPPPPPPPQMRHACRAKAVNHREGRSWSQKCAHC